MLTQNYFGRLQNSSILCVGDACTNYNILNEPKRNSNHSGSDATPDCDNSVGGDWKGDNWYRFVEPAGTSIANSIVPVNHCGTDAPGWLNGTHPVTLGETVTRQVCFHWSNDPCKWNADVQIKRCDGFFVYQLPDTPTCDLKYCGLSGNYSFDLLSCKIII